MLYLLPLITILLGYSALANETASEFNPSSVLTYKTVGKSKLKLDVFNPKNHKASHKKTVIVFFFRRWLGDWLY